jgi:WD40 repeat protein
VDTGAVALAPDGKTLAVAATDAKREQVVTSVSVMDLATGKELHRIPVSVQAGVLAPTYSPDGKTLAFANGNTIHLYEAATGKQIRQLDAEGALVGGLAFSPDGKTLAEKDMGAAAIRLYEVATGKVRRVLGTGAGDNRHLFAGLPGGGRDLAFSPDGKWLAVGDGNAVRLWDVAAGRQVAPVGHGGEISAVVIGPGGKFVASRGADNTIRLWDPATGKQRRQYHISAGGLTPDCQTVAVSLGDSIRVYDVTTGRERHRLKGHPKGTGALTFSPDGKLLAARGSFDPTVRLYDVATGKELRQLAVPRPNNQPGAGKAVVMLWGAGGPAGSGLVFSPDGRLLASSDGGTANNVGVMVRPGAPVGPGGIVLHVWEVATGKEVRRISLPDGPAVTSFAFSPDGWVLATDNQDQTVTLWEVASGKERMRLGKAPPPVAPPGMLPAVVAGGLGRGVYLGPAAPTTLAFTPNGRTLAARGPDRSVRIWDVARGKQLGQFQGHEGNVTTLALSDDGNTLATGSADTTVLVWDVTRFRPAKPQHVKLTPRELDALWADLQGDAGKAYQAMQKLATAPGQAVAFLGERVRPVEPADAKKLERLLADLTSDRFRVREQASQELERLGDLAVPALRKILEGEPALETRRRVEKLLEKLTVLSLTPEQTRQVRALEVLEGLHTAEARPVLTALSRGAAGALLTREAQAALARLGKRTGS